MKTKSPKYNQFSPKINIRRKKKKSELATCPIYKHKSKNGQHHKSTTSNCGPSISLEVPTPDMIEAATGANSYSFGNSSIVVKIHGNDTSVKRKISKALKRPLIEHQLFHVLISTKLSFHLSLDVKVREGTD